MVKKNQVLNAGIYPDKLKFAKVIPTFLFKRMIPHYSNITDQFSISNDIKGTREN